MQKEKLNSYYFKTTYIIIHDQKCAVLVLRKYIKIFNINGFCLKNDKKVITTLIFFNL